MSQRAASVSVSEVLITSQRKAGKGQRAGGGGWGVEREEEMTPPWSCKEGFSLEVSDETLEVCVFPVRNLINLVSITANKFCGI